MGNFLISLLLVFVLFVCKLSVTKGSDVIFSASPTSLHPPLTEVLTFKCSLKDGGATPGVDLVGRSLPGHNGQTRDKSVESTEHHSRYDAPLTEIRYVNSIVVSHEGVDVASLTEHSPPSPQVNVSGLQVSGSLPGGAGERGYLQVSYWFPTHAQSGVFTCGISGIDQTGHSHFFSSSLQVSMEEVAQDDLIREIQETRLVVREMNQTVQDQKQMVEDMKNIIDALQSDVTTLKLKQQVYFTVSLSHPVNLSANQVLVFDDVITNLGSGYDVTSGIFLCPTDGVYLFQVHVLSDLDQKTNFQIQLNGRRVVTTASDSNMENQSSSNSVVLSLTQGDKVRVVSTRKAFPRGSSFHYTTFTGSLLSPTWS